MKFPRNVRIFSSHLDAAPIASVFFVLVLFVLLGTLVYTPGVPMPLELPRASGLPGTAGPRVAVAVDAAGQFYFENQLRSEAELRRRLEALAKSSPERITLVVLADKAVNVETLMRLETLATQAGLEPFLAVLPP